MVSKFYQYELPKERIAQLPMSATKLRSDSRLIHARRGGNTLDIQDRGVAELAQILRAGDLLILNNSKVRPCRFFFPLPSGKEAEVLLVRASEQSGVFEALARPMKQFETGAVLSISSSLRAEVLGRAGEEHLLKIRLTVDAESQESLEDVIEREALMPIPPYIRGGHAEAIDRELYQTIFAQETGSIAAPTAGLHFTEQLLEELYRKGIGHAFITLHVGTASFRPAEQQDPNLVEMEREYFRIPNDTLQRIQETKQGGGRVVVVGTTSTRALESYFLDRAKFPGVVREESNGYLSSTLMIKPGFHFQVVDVLFTNFHQPGSTHLLLVGAFAGESGVSELYEHGLKQGYRFLSYGDAMLIE